MMERSSITELASAQQLKFGLITLVIAVVVQVNASLSVSPAVHVEVLRSSNIEFFNIDLTPTAHFTAKRSIHVNQSRQLECDPACFTENEMEEEDSKMKSKETPQELQDGINSSTFSAETVANHEYFVGIGDITALRETAREMFLHAYDSYIEFGYPHDEVKPISCTPRVHWERTRGTLDDTLGGYMTTLVDSLDTLLVLKEFDRFEKALELLKTLDFDKDVNVSVFETNIRIIGGLLSAHQLAVHTQLRRRASSAADGAVRLDDAIDFEETIYDGHTLLDLAIAIGDKLLPAFSTKTGIPYHRVNLLFGRIRGETVNTCTAAGGSFLLEMSLLSLLSGNPAYAKVAFKATDALWSRRSSIGLVGSDINVKSGKWNHKHTGIGAGVDSFYETLLKTSILLNDNRLLHWFRDAYSAVEVFTRYGPWHLDVDMVKGNSVLPHSPLVSALGAFWPALQVLYGDIGPAQETFEAFLSVWRQFGALPDIFNLQMNRTINYCFDSPLRPELLESAYHLFSATRSPTALQFAVDWLNLTNTHTRTRCGFASIADVNTLINSSSSSDANMNVRLDDRMDSFVLAESLKYLYLILDEAHTNPSHRDTIFCDQPQQQASVFSSTTDTEKSSKWSYQCVQKSASLFSTEGHVLLLPLNSSSPSSSGSESSGGVSTEFITNLFGSTSVLPLDLVCSA